MPMISAEYPEADVAELDALVARQNFETPERRVTRSSTLRLALRQFLDAATGATPVPADAPPIIRQRQRVPATA